MFRITNLQTRQQETCANRDELLSVINEKSVWAEDRREVFTLQLEQLTEDGGILDHMSLPLPLQSIVEEALDGFGLKREKKSFAFLQRHKTSKNSVPEEVSEEEPTETAEQDRTTPISASLEEKELTEKAEEEKEEALPKQEHVSKSKKIKALKKKKSSEPSKVERPSKTHHSTRGFIWNVLTIGALGLSLTSFFLLQHQSKTIKELENRVTLEANQGKVEVVGRFFIANYYSGNDANLKNFLSKDLKTEKLTAKTDEQVQSTIYESISETKGAINVTFVITTKDQNDSIKTVRLTLPFQENQNATYGYVLVNQPQFSSFGE